MHSKRTGRIVRYATLALVVVVIFNVTGCSLGSMFSNINYLSRLVGGMDGIAGLGI